MTDSAKSLKPSPAASQPESAPGERRETAEPRRNFLVELTAVVIGLVVSLSSFVVGLVFFFDPLLRDKNVPRQYRQPGGSEEGFLRVTTLDAIPDDGVPRRFPVIADQSDGWNFIPEQSIGSVFLRRNKGESTVQVLHTTCPHAGCAVSYDSDHHRYLCPCHNSAFALEGERIDLEGKANPSPRSMDALEVDEQRLAQSGEVWIRFLNFYTGIHEQKPKI